MANEKKINIEKYVGSAEGWEGMSEIVVNVNGKWIPRSQFMEQIAENIKKNKKTKTTK